VKGIFFEKVPLLDSDEFYKNDFINYNSLAINLLISNLHENFQKQEIFYLKFHGERSENGIEKKKISFEDGLQWDIHDDDISTHLKKLKYPKSNFQFILNYVPDLKKSKSCKEFKTYKEVQSFILLKLLEYMSYFDKDFKLTVYGESLASVKQEKERNNSDDLVTFIELLKCGYFDKWENEELNDDDYINLISMIMSLYPMNLKPIQWNGEISKILIQFHSVVKKLNESLRNIIEMLLVSIFMQKKLNSIEPKHLFSKLSFNLPYYEDINLTMGIVTKEILKTPTKEFDEFIKNINEKFPSCVDPLNDLNKATKFWDQCLQVLSSLAKNNKHKKIHEVFLNADKILKKKKTLFGVFIDKKE
jgi:hypothetical protein